MSKKYQSRHTYNKQEKKQKSHPTICHVNSTMRANWKLPKIGMPESYGQRL